MNNPTTLERAAAAPGPLPSTRADLSWHDAAACQYTDPEVFFPEKGGSVRPAKKICAGCPVKDLCLEWALANDERFGIYGAKSERERRAIARARGMRRTKTHCKSGKHVRTPANIEARSGRCLDCRAESDKAARQRRTAKEQMERKAGISGSPGNTAIAA
jgi:hypothetical protein